MVVQLRAQDIIDPETEAHYRFRQMLPGPEQDGRITSQLHQHDFFELFLVTNGRLLHIINGQEIVLNHGALVFIRPQDQHCFRQLDDLTCSLINLAFPDHTVHALFAYLGDGFNAEHLLRAKLPPTTQLAKSNMKAVISRLTQLNSIPHFEKQHIRTQLRLVLSELMGRYFAEDSHQPITVSPVWLHELCQQMKDPVHLQGGVAKMRELAHTSAEHLSRTFRKELGCTPTQYVNNCRLTYAANMLIRSDRPIADISLEVGIENMSYFYRIFKQKYHLTPAQFRAKNRIGALL